MTSKATQRAPGRPKSEQKRMQILSGASELLLAQGYDNTSMEAVAKASGVSKQTVYSHFTNKEALYKAIIETKCAQYQIEEATICIESQSLTDTLTLIGYKFTKLLNDDNVIAMYKLVIGESKPNDHSTKLFYDTGPLHSVQIVANLLMQHPASKLSEAQAKEASHDFFNLLKSDFHLLSMLQLPFNLSDEEQHLHAHKVATKTMLLISQCYVS